MVARLLAVVTCAVAVAGLLAISAAESRIWGNPGDPDPEPWKRIVLLLVVTAPHWAAIASAFLARRSLAGGAIVLVGTAFNTWLAVLAWRADHLGRSELALGLMQTLSTQILALGLVVGGGAQGWQWANRGDPSDREPPGQDDPGEQGDTRNSTG